MTKYFVKFENGNKCKNNAEIRVEEQMKALDGTLLPDETSKKNFINTVRKMIDDTSMQFRRCKPVQFSHWNMDLDEATHISIGGGICYLRIYIVRHEKNYEYDVSVMK